MPWSWQVAWTHKDSPCLLKEKMGFFFCMMWHLGHGVWCEKDEKSRVTAVFEFVSWLFWNLCPAMSQTLLSKNGKQRLSSNESIVIRFCQIVNRQGDEMRLSISLPSSSHQDENPGFCCMGNSIEAVLLRPHNCLCRISTVTWTFCEKIHRVRREESMTHFTLCHFITYLLFF